MRHRRKAKIIPFSARSAKQRKKGYIEIKNKIRESAAEFGGLFWSEREIDGDSWYEDFYFIGKDKTVYNVFACTALWQYFNDVKHAAVAAARDRAPADEWFTFERTEHGTHRMISHDGAPENFDGLSRFDWIRKEEERLAESGDIVVFENTTIDRGYAFGVGIHATIDARTITVELINQFIRAFIANGEQSFKGNKPFSFAYADIRPDRKSQAEQECECG